MRQLQHTRAPSMPLKHDATSRLHEHAVQQQCLTGEQLVPLREYPGWQELASQGLPDVANA